MWYRGFKMCKVKNLSYSKCDLIKIIIFQNLKRNAFQTQFLDDENLEENSILNVDLEQLESGN